MSDEDQILERELNFSYVINNKLAGCAGPQFAEHLEFLARQGVSALVRLAAVDEAAFSSAEIGRAGFIDCHEPVEDWSAPRQQQIDRIIGFIQALIKRGKKVAVTCAAGRGRTGTVLACYFVSQGMSADAAIEFIRCKRHGSVEERDPYGRSTGQKEAILEFERRLRAGEVTL